MKLKGADGLEDRLTAIRKVPPEVSKRWADGYVRAARPMIPVVSGKTRQSLRQGRTGRKGASVVGSYVLFFIDAGTKEHAIPKVRKRRSKKAPAKTLMFQGRGGTVFARKVDHPRTEAHPFRVRASEEAFRRQPISRTLIDLWNRAD